MNLFHDVRLLNRNLSHFCDFIEKLPGPSHIKDAKTGKYIYSNHHDIVSLNINSIDDLIGLEAKDILSKNSIFYSNLDLNPKILHWIMVDASLQFEHTIKFPIPSQDNQNTIAILTYTEDITHQINLYRLFQLYQEFYPKDESIKQFLKYLKIDFYFHRANLPTL